MCFCDYNFCVNKPRIKMEKRKFSSAKQRARKAAAKNPKEEEKRKFS